MNAFTDPEETEPVPADEFAEIDQAIKHVYLTELPGAVKRAVDERLREIRRDFGGYGLEGVTLPKEVLALPVAHWYVSEGRAGFWSSRTVDEGHVLLAECPSFEAAERVSEGLQALTRLCRCKAVLPAVSAPVSTEDTDLRETLRDAMEAADSVWGIGAQGVAGFTKAAVEAVRPLLDAKDAEKAGLRKDLYWSNNTLVTRTRQQEDWAAAEHKARRERDKARAEVEQLRAVPKGTPTTYRIAALLTETWGADDQWRDHMDKYPDADDRWMRAAEAVRGLFAAAPVSSVEPEQADDDVHDENNPPKTCPFNQDGQHCVFGAGHTVDYHHMQDGTNVPAVPEQAQPRYAAPCVFSSTCFGGCQTGTCQVLAFDMANGTRHCGATDMTYERPESIECDGPPLSWCDAEWEPNGTLRKAGRSTSQQGDGK